jgi:hypothetical protein
VAKYRLGKKGFSDSKGRRHRPGSVVTIPDNVKPAKGWTKIEPKAKVDDDLSGQDDGEKKRPEGARAISEIQTEPPKRADGKEPKKSK